MLVSTYIFGLNWRRFRSCGWYGKSYEGNRVACPEGGLTMLEVSELSFGRPAFNAPL
jgi:hypothetical protein